VNRYAAAVSGHPLATHAVGEVAGELLEALGGATPDLLAWFVSPHHIGAIEDIHRALGTLTGARTTVATTAVSVIGGSREIEETPGLSAFAAVWPDHRLTPVRLGAVETPDGSGLVGWPDDLADAHTLVLLGDPFSLPAEEVLEGLVDRAPRVRVVGGLASAGTRPGANRLVLDGRIHTDGAVGVAIAGGAPVGTVVSQGCRPLGEPFTVTAAEGRFITTLGGRPALERLRETASAATEAERDLLRRGVHIGIAVDEQRDELGRGDFLIRTVIGGDRETGAIAVGARVAVGTTVRFQVRDAASADEDLALMLGGEEAAAALLFTCNGRGSHLFGTPDHDALAVQGALGPLPLAGMACAGEFGPVGPGNHLHGFTASVALLPG
jgi:small ligand-binding sensory domain FIST